MIVMMLISRLLSTGDVNFPVAIMCSSDSDDGGTGVELGG